MILGSNFRSAAYLYSLFFILIFKLLCLIIPGLKKILLDVEGGNTGLPAIELCLLSGMILDALLFISVKFQEKSFISEPSKTNLLIAIYPVLVLVGWFALRAKAGYEKNSNGQPGG